MIPSILDQSVMQMIDLNVPETFTPEDQPRPTRLGSLRPGSEVKGQRRTSYLSQMDHLNQLDGV